MANLYFSSKELGIIRYFFGVFHQFYEFILYVMSQSDFFDIASATFQKIKY